MKKDPFYENVCIVLEPSSCNFLYCVDTIPCAPLPVQSLGPQQSDVGVTKKRRKRRRKTRPEGGGGRREESEEEFSEDEDMFTIDLSSDEEREGDSGRCVSVYIRKLCFSLNSTYFQK